MKVSNTSNTRDDFSSSTKSNLANRVGGICSKPGCNQVTFGPHSTNPNKYINIGVAAHITAASKKGPRYNHYLTSMQRKAFDNGIWLCQKCGKLVDSDESKYEESELRRWKKIAEDEQFKKIDPISSQIEGISDEEEMIKLIKILMRKSTAGFHSELDLANLSTTTGTIGFMIFPVQYKENIKILDLIGGISKNRISIIMEADNIVKLIFLDSLRGFMSIKYKLPDSKIAELILLTWNNKKISMWYKGDLISEFSLAQQLRGNWSALASGIDIDGSNNASYVVPGVRGGGGIGLGLCSSDKSIQIIVSDLFLVSRVLSDKEIRKLQELNT